MSSPRLPLKPNIFLLLALAVNLAFVGLAIWLGLSGNHNPAYHFDEGRLMTWFSVGQLLAIGALAGITMKIRASQTPWTGLHTSWIIWGLLCAGFVFLAADDGLKIHEHMDGLIHKLFHLKETALTDRIDDAIIGVYGLAGLFFLFLYRRELFQFRSVLPYIIVAFVLAFITVGLDMMGNRKEWLQSYFETKKQVNMAHHWIETAEGTVQSLAEAFFLIAFWAAAWVASTRIDSKAKAEEMPVETTVAPS